MGKIIAFRGPFRGIGRATAAMDIIGVGLARKEKTIVALTQVPGRREHLEEAFDENIPGSISREVYSKNGLWALWQRFRTERLSIDEVRESAVKTSMESLDIFPYMPCGNFVDDRTKLAITALILSDIKKAYDYVLVDTGDEINDFTKAVISGSDAVVCALPQSVRKWRAFFDEEDLSLNAEKTVFVMNGANTAAEPGIRQVERMFRKALKGRKVLEIPFLAEVVKAVDEGRMCEIAGEKRFSKIKSKGKAISDHADNIIRELTEVCESGGSK